MIIGDSSAVQVKVRDIHVRYEDGVTNPDTLLAAGITLHSLELKVCTIVHVCKVARKSTYVCYCGGPYCMCKDNLLKFKKINLKEMSVCKITCLVAIWILCLE